MARILNIPYLSLLTRVPSDATVYFENQQPESLGYLPPVKKDYSDYVPKIWIDLYKDDKFQGIMCQLSYDKKLLFGEKDATYEKYSKFFRNDQTLVFEDKTPKCIRRILEILMSSPSAVGDLEKLDMAGCGNFFGSRWFIMMAPLLYSLQELDVTNCEMTNEDFSDICVTLKNLDHLHMSGTKVTNLTGISQLKNLKVLIMVDCQIESPEAMEEIFKLKELTTLDISGLRLESMKNAEYFWSSRLVLPKLKILDCSENYMTGLMIQHIILSHPTITCIGLYNVPVENFLPLRTIKILDSTSLENCTAAVDYYSKSYNVHARRISQVMTDAVTMFLKKNFEQQSQQDLHKYLLTVLQLTKHRKDAYLDQALSYSFLWLNRDNFTLTRGEIQSIAKWIPTVLHWEWQIEDLSDVHWDTHFFAWHVLTTGRILESVPDILMICERAIELMEKMKDLDILFPKISLVLALGLSYMEDRGIKTNSAKTKLEKNKVLHMKMLEFISRSTKEECITPGVALITRNQLKNDDKEYRVLFINTILDYFEKTYSSHSLLLRFVDQKKFEKYEIDEFLKKNRMEMYLNCIHRQDEDLRPTTILLLARLYHSVHNKQFDVANEIYDRQIQKTAHDLMKFYFKMHKFNDKDRLGVFKRIKQCKRKAPDEVIAWTEWFLSFFEEKKEGNSGKKVNGKTKK